MKNKKFLPLIIIAPILASCSSSGVRDVKFEDYSNKVEYSDFVKKLRDIKPFYLCSDSLKSFSVTGFDDYSYSVSQQRNNKEKYFNSTVVNEDSSGGYDAKNSTYLTKVKSKNQYNLKSTSLESSTYNENELEYEYQESSVNNVKSVVKVDLNNKKYSVQSVASALSSVELLAKTMLIDLSTPSLSDWAGYSLLSDEEKQNYSFYVDDNIFTIKYLKEYDDNEYRTKDDKVVAKAHIYNELTWQYIYNDTKIKNQTQSKNELTLTALEDMTYELKQLLKNDTYTVKDYSSESVEVNVEDYSLEAVDLSTYIKN